MAERHEQMIEELRKQEEVRDLLRDLERRLGGADNPEASLEDRLRRLERLAGSFPEGHMARLLIESAVSSVRVRDVRRAGSDVSRSHSAIEGRISTLRGSLSREGAEE